VAIGKMGKGRKKSNSLQVKREKGGGNCISPTNASMRGDGEFLGGSKKEKET